MIDDVFQMNRTLGQLPERSMRVHKLQEIMQSASSDEVVFWLERVLVAMQHSRKELSDLYLAFVVVMLEYEASNPLLLSNWIEAAVQQNCYMAATVLSRPEELATKPLPIRDAQLAAKTLGEQKAMARKATGADSERFFTVSDPQVVKILINNPHMSEKYMVRYLAMRPLAESTVIQVVLHEKWSAMELVRETILSNPTAPQWITIKLLPASSAHFAQTLKLLPQTCSRLKDWNQKYLRL